MDHLKSATIVFPIWALPKDGKMKVSRYWHIHDAALDIEFYHPVMQVGVDLSDKWILLDDLGRRLDAVFDRSDVIRCELESIDPQVEDVLLLEKIRAETAIDT